MKMKFLVTILLLMFTLSSCGNSKDQKDEGTSKVEETGEVNEAIELLKSLNKERAESFKAVTTAEFFGMSTVTNAYFDKDKIRVEMGVQGLEGMGDMPANIFIYLKDENALYSFVEGDMEGAKVLEVSEEQALDMSGSLGASSLQDLIGDEPQNIIVEKTELDGEEVVYIEAKEDLPVAEGEDAADEMLVKMWYSEKYGIFLKYEIYAGEELFMTSTVTEVSSDVEFDEAMFTPPADIEYEEVTVEEMMNSF